MDKNKPYRIDKDFEIKELVGKLSALWRYLLAKWVLIVTFGLVGASLGLTFSFFVKPKYTAHISFALIDKTSGGGGLASIASSFGLGGMFGGGDGSAFSGDNLLEIIKSRYVIEKTLLAPIDFYGEEKTMIDAYIQFNDLHEKWKKSRNIELRTLNYPINQKRETFSRTQDSILNAIYMKFIKSNDLNVVRKEKKISIVYLNFKSLDETFSKSFAENLIGQTYKFYKETRTAQSRANLEMMQHKADSIKTLYENALYAGAEISMVNVNRAVQLATVPRLKQEYDVQLYGTVYAEVLKNLETLKLDMLRETPIIQLIDEPIYPLKEEKLGKLKGLVFGGFIGGGLILVYLLGMFYLKEML